MTIQDIILFSGIMVPLTFSAGPNTVMCGTIGGRFGLYKAIPFMGGMNSAILIYSIATGFGLGFITERYPVALDIVKYIGVIYIFYLAWKFIKASTKIEKENKTPGFSSGFIIGILNPKIIAVTILMYSQFLSPGPDKIIQVIVLTIGLLIFCIGGQLLWALGGNTFSKLLTSPQAIKKQNYIFGAMLLMVGIWILVR